MLDLKKHMNFFDQLDELWNIVQLQLNLNDWLSECLFIASEKVLRLVSIFVNIAIMVRILIKIHLIFIFVLTGFSLDSTIAF